MEKETHLREEQKDLQEELEELEEEEESRRVLAQLQGELEASRKRRKEIRRELAQLRLGCALPPAPGTVESVDSVEGVD